MVFKETNFTSSRRRFLKNTLPIGSFLCFGLNNLLSYQQTSTKQQIDTEKHPFFQDAEMTAREVFQFAYQMGFIQYMKKFEKYLGKEKLLEMLRKATVEADVELVSSIAKGMRKTDFAMWKILTHNLDPPFSLARVFETVEDTDKAFEWHIKECLWAKTFQEADAAEIGYAYQCYSGAAQASAFNPKLKFTNPKNLMKGDDICIYRYVWEE
jgi:hypothetical protein